MIDATCVNTEITEQTEPAPDLPDGNTEIRYSISELEFENGSKLEFGQSDFVVFVGPNSAGKT